MKKIVIILLCFCFLMGNLCFSVAAEKNENDCGGIDAQSAIIENSIVSNVTAAVVYEVNSDTMMYAMNIDEKLYPASFVKIMTALIALERGNLTDEVTVTQEALNAVSPGAVTKDLMVGEKLSLKDLVYCMLTGSANDAAAVIAVHLGGSVSNFVNMMNVRAGELGCTNTNFVDPHGIQSRGQYSTARDMVRIIRAALEVDGFRDVFGAVNYTVSSTNFSPERELKTANYMMDNRLQNYYDRRVTGGRTGVAANLSRCVAVTASSGNMEVISVVFGAKPRFAADGYTVEFEGGFKEISQMLDATISTYRIAQVFYQGQALSQRVVSNGDNDLVLVPAEGKTVLVPKDFNADDLEYRYTDAGKTYVAPIEQGSAQGSVEVWLDGKCLATVSLLAGNNVAVSHEKLVQLNHGDNDNAVVWIVLVILAVVAVVAYFRFKTLSRRKGRGRRPAARRRHYE